MKPNLIRKLLALLLILGLIATACSSDDSAATSEESFDGATDNTFAAATAEPGAPAVDEGEDLAREAGSDSQLGNGVAIGTQIPVDLGRNIIFTAFLTVAVTDVADASAEATRIIQEPIEDYLLKRNGKLQLKEKIMMLFLHGGMMLSN